MPAPLARYLAQRSDASAFLLPAELDRTVEDLFPDNGNLLPQPYRIFPADETQTPLLGFPLSETLVMKDLDARLDRWLAEEVPWQISRQQAAREKVQAALNAYMSQLMRAAENALMSNLLSDYHGVFWLAHSLDLSRQFSSIPRRVGMIDTQMARTQGDSLKYRIYSRWATEAREQLTQVAGRVASILDGEEQRALQFFRLLQEDVLIFTEEFVGPDLRELRSFVTGYLRRDFQSFRDGFERLRTTATDLVARDRSVRAVLPLFGVAPDSGVTLALLLDGRFQGFLFDHPAVQNVLSREDREQFQLISRRMREFAILNQLRRGILWMVEAPDGQIVSADRRQETKFSRSTRPLDFGRPGVVDPMIYRFGLIYDISKFSETLGNIRRGGGKEEIKSYRQMLLFQRRMETIAQRHRLQFEKFLGDGAFYTTRRALRLVRAAVEIQSFYTEMKRKGFAFNKGLRVALNYGYYRLLPMKGAPDSTERITEFYGPGIVELSRLTTGKANKEIEEIANFLVAHGFDSSKVQQFFAPLARGVDVIDHTQHAREYYAYVNDNNNLVNEGIVASGALLHELSIELGNEAQPLYRLRTPWATYIGFSPAVANLEFLGIRLLGMVQLKGLDDVEVAEIVPLAVGDAEATLIETGESLVTLLRQDLHAEQPRQQPRQAPLEETFDDSPRGDTTSEHFISSEIVICARTDDEVDSAEVVIGEWDPRSDDVRRPVRLPRGDFERLFAVRGDFSTGMLALNKSDVRDLYDRLSDHGEQVEFTLGSYRMDNDCETWVIGDVVEKL